MILLRSPKCPSLPITLEPVRTHTADDRFSFTAASARASLGLSSDLEWSLPGSRYGNYGPLQFDGLSITRTEGARRLGRVVTDRGRASDNVAAVTTWRRAVLLTASACDLARRRYHLVGAVGLLCR